MALGSVQTVGRESELQRLEAALGVLGEGSSACVALEGEPGIGKTRLLAELTALATKRGHLALSGTAAEFEQDVPFGVWVNTLDSHLAEQDAGWDAALLEELGGIFPSLRGRGAGDSTVADERYRAHRAVRALLELLAERRPVVLVLDDLHWSDRASIELLAALMRRAPDAPVLLAFGFRPGQAPERLSAALAAPGVIRIEPGRLSQAEAAEMLTNLDQAALATIYRHGGGNPFYLEQLARASDAGRLPGALRHAGDGADEPAGALPAAVTAALAEELESLSLPARALLNGAAVAGEPFSPELAAAVAELAEDEGLAALDDLIERDLVRATGVPRQFIFRHPLVRRAVYESTRGGWRLAAHARAAEALGARAPAPPSVRTTSSSRPARATRPRWRCCWRPARRRRRARRARPAAGSPRRCACCPRPTASASRRCAPPWPPPCARPASSRPAATRCSRRSSCCPPTPPSGESS